MKFARTAPDPCTKFWSLPATGSRPALYWPALGTGRPLAALRLVHLAPGASWAEVRARSEIWLPLAAEVLDRHGLRLAPGATLGPGGSYPVVLSDEVVVKFFGFAGEWAATWINEGIAHERLALDTRIRAPRLIGSGKVFSGDDQPLPYLILTRVSGVSWCDARMNRDQRLSIACDLGTQLRMVHALPHHALPTIASWQIGTPGEGARFGQFPSWLAADVDEWLETVPMASATFVHSDIFERHPFVEHGRLSGIIDWGDAMAADPHVELAKLHLDVFAGDKGLLRALLDGYDWPIDREFSRRALGMALWRHAQIHGQHGPGGDVFYRAPALLGDRRPATLDELADMLFGV